jgi:ketosteroid isomerase-like protein
VSNSIATVQELYAAFGRGDIPAIMSSLADDVVWESEAPAIISFGGIRHGKTETQDFFAGLAKDHSNPLLTIAEIISSGDTVMAIGRYTATVKATGRKLDSPIAHYWKLRDGKIARYVGLFNTGAAVEAMQPLSAGASG